MTTLRRILTGTALAVMAAGMAGATTTGYTTITPAGGGTGGSGFDFTDFNYTLTLPKFDSTLGTLTGVKLYYYALLHTTALEISSNSSQNENFDLDVNSRINYQGLANSANAADSYGQEQLVLISLANITLGPGGSGACPFATPSASCSDVTYAPPNLTADNSGFGSLSGVGDGTRVVTGVLKNGTNLAAYQAVGGGTFTLSSRTKALSSFSGGGGNINVNQSTKARFEAEVDYTYTAFSGTPEPSTMILFGSALVGLGFLRKRSK